MREVDVIFEWDEHKRCENLRKHGLDFRDCAGIFRWRTLTFVDHRFDYGEERWRTIGMLRERVVLLVYVVRGNVFRVISLRKADKDEQTSYFESFED
jgi:uncharacterized DUF497 family protein